MVFLSELIPEEQKKHINTKNYTSDYKKKLSVYDIISMYHDIIKATNQKRSFGECNTIINEVHDMVKATSQARSIGRVQYDHERSV